MNELIKTQAIVLKSKNFGEADKISTIFSGSNGLMQALVKGSRKAKSKLTAGTQFLSRADFVLFRGKSFYTVTQCEQTKAYLSLYKDAERYIYACIVSEITLIIANEEESNYELYDLLIFTLNNIDVNDKPVNFVIYFMLKSLEISGFKPEFSRCVFCGEKTVSGHFDIKNGGIVCSKCLKNIDDEKSLITFDNITYAVLKYMQSASYYTAEKIDVQKATLIAIFRFMLYYIRYHMEKDVKSIKYILSYLS